MLSGPRERPKPCRLCETDLIPGFAKEHQQLLSATNATNQEIRAHYFCLLFSSGLGQRGEESEGLQGFLPSDIRRELRRGARLKCVYCKKKGATVGCAKPQCKKSYHLPCGMANHSLQQYYDQFKSFCSAHRPAQKVKGSRPREGKEVCGICQDAVPIPPAPTSLWTPCCGSIFHSSCIQTAAMSSGSLHFRCPLCNDVQRFVTEMEHFGMYIPSRTVLWESSNQSPLEGGKPMCHARLCFCDKLGPNHRFYNSIDTSWEILGCFSCGHKGIHARCGGLDEYNDPHWYCYQCRHAETGGPPKEKTLNRSIVTVWGTATAKKTHAENQQPSNSPKVTDLVSTSPETSPAKEPLENHKVKIPVKRTSDLMTITLEEIIVKGLDEKLRETNYRSKIFSSMTIPPSQPDATFSVPTRTTLVADASKSRHKSQDSSNSPGDSDYESAQETLPFKVRRVSPGTETDPGAKKPAGDNWNSPPPSVVIRKSGPVSNGHDRKLHLNQSDFIDQKIQNSIKEFFRESAEQN